MNMLKFKNVFCAFFNLFACTVWFLHFEYYSFLNVMERVNVPIWIKCIAFIPFTLLKKDIIALLFVKYC
jgi:hypothetical protein